MSKKNNKKNKPEQKLVENTYTKHISFLPIVLMLAIVPLILRWHIIPLDQEVSRFWTGETEMDLFCMGKSIMIMLLAVMMFVSLFFMVDKHNIKNDSSTKIIFGTIGIFLAVSILSSLTSDYRGVALWGAPERHEGLVMYICYIIMLIYTYFMVKEVSDFKYIKYALIFLSAVMFIIGMSQIMGRDVLASDFVSRLVIPKEYWGSVTPKNTNGAVYLTLMNQNYVGSYAAMIIPFFGVLAISNYENKTMRTVAGIIAIATTVILVKANSQAGLVGLALSAIVIFVIYSKKIFTNRKLLIGLIVILIATVSIGNIANEGRLIWSVNNIRMEAEKIFSSDSNFVFDPTYAQPVYDAEASGNKVRFETIAGQLNMEFVDGLNVNFTGANGESIESIYYKENQKYKLSSLYEKLELSVSSGNSESYSQLALNYDNFTYLVLEWKKGDGAYLIDSHSNRYELKAAPHIGFEGKEKLGSGRGYIWSRTLPLIAQKPLLGYGPDNFLMAFPQHDMAAKTYVYNNPFMITDKPHNIYLLYAVNSGIFALLSMFILWGAYIADSLNLYALKKEYTSGDYYGSACLVAIIGYLGAGFFNDSVPVISPVFWVILGAGFAINYINRKDRMNTDK